HRRQLLRRSDRLLLYLHGTGVDFQRSTAIRVDGDGQFKRAPAVHLRGSLEPTEAYQRGGRAFEPDTAPHEIQTRGSADLLQSDQRVGTDLEDATSRQSDLRRRL